MSGPDHPRLLTYHKACAKPEIHYTESRSRSTIVMAQTRDTRAPAMICVHNDEEWQIKVALTAEPWNGKHCIMD
jgi:hypothetical protein